MCDECKVWFQQKTSGAIPGAKSENEKQNSRINGFSKQKSTGQNAGKETFETEVSNKKKNVNMNSKIIGISAAIILVIVLTAVIFSLGNEKSAENTETDGIYEKNDEINQNDVGAESDADTGKVDEEVMALNQIYSNQIKSYSDLDSFRFVSVDGNTFYYLDEQLVEIDVKNRQESEGYSGEYYFNNGTLYYANIYKSSNAANELYFDNDILIRWKDVDGTNHDKEYDSAAFNEWYDYQTEAYDLFFMYENQEGVENDKSDEFVFPNSDTEYLSESDLTGLSAWEIRVGRNEIMARHGRRFRDEELQNYFNSCPWYSGTMDPETFDHQYDTILNQYEKENADLIKEYENKLENN